VAIRITFQIKQTNIVTDLPRQRECNKKFTTVYK
jgi:hypothetical protein